MPSATPAGLSPRRRQLLDAAVEVVAEQGLRGLTHRAVDRRAGVAEGSVSAYFRTRQALQVAAAEHVAASLAADVEELAAELAERPGDRDRALELTQALFDRWLADGSLVRARLELTMEAGRDPAVAEVLAGWRSRLVEVVEQILTTAGKLHSAVRAEALVASFDGLLIAGLQKPQAERRVFLSESLRLVLEGLTEPG